MRKFILGTDWWTDCDDAMAVRLLANAVLSKKAELLGVGINACMEYSTASLNRFLRLTGFKPMSPVSAPFRHFSPFSS